MCRPSASWGDPGKLDDRWFYREFTISKWTLLTLEKCILNNSYAECRWCDIGQLPYRNNGKRFKPLFQHKQQI